MATAPVMVPDPKRRPRRTAMRVAGSSRLPEICYDRPIQNSYLRREPDLKQRGKCFRIAVLCAVGSMLVFGIALVHSKCVSYGYEISQLKTERAELKEANQQLRLEQARLADPQRIDLLARRQLGLTSSEPQQLIRVSGSGEQSPEPGNASVMARNYETLEPVQRGIPREP